MIKELSQQIRDVCIELYDADIDPELTRPEQKFGDFASNVALRLAKRLGKNPRQIATEIKDSAETKLPSVSAVSVEGPGFINFRLSDEKLFESAQNIQPDNSLKGQTYVVEYSDPNPFKILHAGHLYTTLVGDAIANMLQLAGADVHRVNYGGDVGLHVAKSMWAITKELGGEKPEKLSKIPDGQKLRWLSDKYVEGNKAYGSDEHARNSIIELNKRVYALHSRGDKDSAFAKIYWTCRQWSYDGFEDLYKKLRVHEFEKYYPESSVAEEGLKVVRQHTGKIYEESDGAVVFRGEEHGLHTRVFITKDGIPTYEAKDVGLIMAKQKDYNFDRSVVITGNEQAQYMQVVLRSIEQFEPQLANSTIHLTHGMLKMRGGTKMSSRMGNVLTADAVLESAARATADLRGQDEPDITLGSVKYAFLKSRIGGDIIYDAQESVSLEGNSGPYLQYALVRAKSILARSKEQGAKSKEQKVDKLDSQERTLARKLSMYPEVFEAAASELSPHHICNYLYETCQIFNRFYESSKVIDSPRSGIRLSLVSSYKEVLERGLGVLGVPLSERM
jgi:arginyl-tRNA synthetase